jgi:hypothetical protein
MLMARLAIELPGVLGSPWRTGPLKAIVFTILYGAVLFLFERAQLLKMVRFVTTRVLRESG